MSQLKKIRTYSRQKKNFTECRFCAAKMDKSKLLDLKLKCYSSSYKKMISFMKLDIDLSENNKLPKAVCPQCHKKCLECYNFFLIVKETQEKLSTMYFKDYAVICMHDSTKGLEKTVLPNESSGRNENGNLSLCMNTVNTHGIPPLPESDSSSLVSHIEPKECFPAYQNVREMRENHVGNSISVTNLQNRITSIESCDHNENRNTLLVTNDLYTHGIPLASESVPVSLVSGHVDPMVCCPVHQNVRELHKNFVDNSVHLCSTGTHSNNLEVNNIKQRNVEHLQSVLNEEVIKDISEFKMMFIALSNDISKTMDAVENIDFADTKPILQNNVANTRTEENFQIREGSSVTELRETLTNSNQSSFSENLGQNRMDVVHNIDNEECEMKPVIQNSTLDISQSEREAQTTNTNNTSQPSVNDKCKSNKENSKTNEMESISSLDHQEKKTDVIHENNIDNYETVGISETNHFVNSDVYMCNNDESNIISMEIRPIENVNILERGIKTEIGNNADCNDNNYDSDTSVQLYEDDNPLAPIENDTIYETSNVSINTVQNIEESEGSSQVHDINGVSTNNIVLETLTNSNAGTTESLEQIKNILEIEGNNASDLISTLCDGHISNDVDPLKGTEKISQGIHNVTLLNNINSNISYRGTNKVKSRKSRTLLKKKKQHEVKVFNNSLKLIKRTYPSRVTKVSNQKKVTLPNISHSAIAHHGLSINDGKLDKVTKENNQKDCMMQVAEGLNKINVQLFNNRKPTNTSDKTTYVGKIDKGTKIKALNNVTLNKNKSRPIKRGKTVTDDYPSIEKRKNKEFLCATFAGSTLLMHCSVDKKSQTDTKDNDKDSTTILNGGKETLRNYGQIVHDDILNNEIENKNSMDNNEGILNNDKNTNSMVYDKSILHKLDKGTKINALHNATLNKNESRPIKRGKTVTDDYPSIEKRKNKDFLCATFAGSKLLMHCSVDKNSQRDTKDNDKNSTTILNDGKDTLSNDGQIVHDDILNSEINNKNSMDNNEDILNNDKIANSMVYDKNILHKLDKGTKINALSNVTLNKNKSRSTKRGKTVTDDLPSIEKRKNKDFLCSTFCGSTLLMHCSVDKMSKTDTKDNDINNTTILSYGKETLRNDPQIVRDDKLNNESDIQNSIDNNACIIDDYERILINYEELHTHMQKNTQNYFLKPSLLNNDENATIEIENENSTQPWRFDHDDVAESDFTKIHLNLMNCTYFDTVKKDMERLTQSQIEDKEISRIDPDNEFLVEKSWETYPWYCVDCDAIFDSAGHLRGHRQYVHKQCSGFTCWDCKKMFYSFKKFVWHVRWHHRAYLSLTCGHCNQRFRNEAECITHTSIHSRKRTCLNCGEMFTDVHALREHLRQFPMKSNTDPGEVNRPLVLKESEMTWKDYEWRCHDCSKVERDLQSLRDHVKEFHDKCFSAQCADCPRSALTLRTFARHAGFHRPHLRQFCPYCDRYFHNIVDLPAHLNAHVTRQNACFRCGETFEDEDLLKKHNKQFEKELKQEKYFLLCHLCGILIEDLSFVHHLTTQHHLTITTVHYQELLNAKMGEIYICDYSAKPRNKQHQKVAKTYICHHCGKIYKKRDGFLTHMLKHDEKKVICKVCDKRFFRKKDLMYHARIHILNRYTCDHCNNTFKWKNCIRQHMYSHTYGCKI